MYLFIIIHMYHRIIDSRKFQYFILDSLELLTIHSTSNRMPAREQSWFILSVMVLLLWWQIVLLFHKSVALHATISDVTTITDITIPVPWQLATGNIHDYLVFSSKCYSRYWEFCNVRFLYFFIHLCKILFLKYIIFVDIAGLWSDPFIFLYKMKSWNLNPHFHSTEK